MVPIVSVQLCARRRDHAPGDRRRCKRQLDYLTEPNHHYNIFHIVEMVLKLSCKGC